MCIKIDRSGKCEGQGRRRLSRHHRSQLVSLYIDVGTVDCAVFVVGPLIISYLIETLTAVEGSHSSHRH